MRRLIPGLKKAIAAAMVAALVWTTPGLEFYAVADDVLAPAQAPGAAERAASPRTGAAPSAAFQGAEVSAAGAGAVQAQGIELPALEGAAAAPSTLGSSAQGGAPSRAASGSLDSESAAESGLTSQAAVPAPAAEPAAAGASRAGVPAALKALATPGEFSRLAPEAPGEEARAASESDFRRLTGETAAHESSGEPVPAAGEVQQRTDFREPRTVAAGPGVAAPRVQSSPLIADIPQPAEPAPVSSVSGALDWVKSAIAGLAALARSAAGLPRTAAPSSQPVARAVAAALAPVSAAASSDNGVARFSEPGPSWTPQALDAAPAPDVQRAPASTAVAAPGALRRLTAAAAATWAGWGALHLAAGLSARAVPLAQADSVSRGAWYHYAAGRGALFFLVPALALTGLFAFQALLYYAVTWLGADVTPSEFSAFVARDALARPGLYRGLLGYGPGGGILKGAFAPAQRPYGALGYVGRFEIFLRPELVRIPWLFRLVLRSKLAEFGRRLGRSPPASNGLFARVLEALSRAGAPFGVAFSGLYGRLPQAVFLERVLHESGVSLKLSGSYDVLMVSRPDAPVEPEDFRWLSGGAADVRSVAAASAEERARGAEGALDDPSNRGRFRAIYLDDPQDWAPRGQDAKLLDFALQRMERVYREAWQQVKPKLLAANKPLSAVQLKVWNQVAGSQVARFGLVKLAARLYAALDDGGVAVIPFRAADPTLGPLQAVLRHWASNDGGYFRLTRVDQPEGGNVLVARKIEPRVKVWLRPASGATVPSGLQNIARDPVKRQAAEEILRKLGFADWLPEFREIGVRVLHIQGEDVGDTRVYASVPRARLRYIAALLAPGQLEASDASFQPLSAPEAAALVEQAAGAASDNGLNESVPREKGPEAWALAGRGEGMLVYDSDTGIWKDHPAFGGRADETDFSNGGNGDTQGHGTHTAGDMVADDGQLQGTAPAARVHMGKVFGPQGAADGDIEASWGEGQKLGADAFNNSLGGEGGADHPLARTASGLTQRKNSKGEYPIVVASAGNSGQDDATVGPPGAGDEVLTVAATTKPGPDGGVRLARYSSGGWAFFNYGYGLVRPVAKPELAGVGGNVNNPDARHDVFERGVISTRSKDAEPGASDEPGGLFTRMSGTSMSGPQVTGAAVIVKAAVYKAAAGNPEALAFARENLPFVVKMLLMSSAEDLRAPAQKSVAGFLNMEAAARAAQSFRLAGDAPGSWRWIQRARAVVDAPRRVYEAAAAAAEKAQTAAKSAGSNNQDAMNAAVAARDAAWDQALSAAQPLLISGLSDASWVVRQYSAFGLLALQDAGALDALVQSASSDPDPRVRQLALQALAVLPPAAATARARGAVTQILNDPAVELRAYAALALARWGEPGAMPALAGLTGVADEPARYGAVWALGQLGDKADGAVLERLAAMAADGAERGEIRDQAAASLKADLPAESAFTAKAVSDLLSVAGPKDILITRGVLGFFQAASQRPGMVKRLAQEPFRPVLAAFVQKYRSSASKQGSLGNLVRLLARLSGSTLGTPPMSDPSGEGVPGVDENLGLVHLIVELPSDAAKPERSVFAAASAAPAAGTRSAMEQALSGVRFPMDAVSSFGGKVRAVLKEGFVTVEVPGYSELAFAQELARRGFLVSAAGPRFMYLRDTGPLSGLPAVHAAGVTGVGTVTLVVDEGLEVDNPAFAGKVIGVANTSGDGAADDVSGESIGHGTHTGNIAAGQQRPDNNPNIGRAPDSYIIAAKVLGANGGSETTVMEGISAAVQILDDANAKLAAYWSAKDAGQAPALPENKALQKAIGQGIRHFVATMNLSLGGPGAKDAAMNLQLRKLHVDRNIMVSVAAGNDGPQEGTANGSSPANEWSVKTVGAADKDKNLTFYSSRGTPDDPIVKIIHYGGAADLNSDACPYLPGGIISALSSKVAEAASQCIVPNAGKPTDQAMSGTSMASPHSAGDDALILQKMLSAFTPQEIESTQGLSLWLDQLAYRGADKMDGKPEEVGAGLRDVKAELAALDGLLKDKPKIVAESLELYKQAKARESKEAQQRWRAAGLASASAAAPLWALVWRALRRPLSAWIESGAVAADNGVLPMRRPDEAAALIERARAYGELRQLRDLLSAGAMTAAGRVEPFAFHTPQGIVDAPSAGLEGFVYEKHELERRLGPDALIGQLDDFFAYLAAQLAPFDWTRGLREDLARLRAEPALPSSEKNARLNAVLDAALKGPRARMVKENPAGWVRDARIYELFPRAYNLRDKRLSGPWTLRLYQRLRDILVARGWSKPRPFFADMTVADFKQLRALGMDTVWTMGIYPSDVVGRGGAAGAVRDDSMADPALGTLDDFRGFVKKAHRAGLKVIADFAPNAAPRPDARAALAGLARDFLVRTGLDGYRVDTADPLWNEPSVGPRNRAVPAREFLDLLAWELKTANPAAALIAEDDADQDRLSAAGFDAILDKAGQGREGPGGYHDALRGRDPRELARALERVAFLTWQVGGAAGLRFSADLDEPSPRREFGPWTKAALFLTLLLPGAQLFRGSRMDWSGADPAVVSFYKGLFHQARVIRRALKRPLMSVVSGERWAGYVLESPGARHAYAVLANPGTEPVTATFARPDLGVSFQGALNGLETKVVALPVSPQPAPRGGSFAGRLAGKKN